MIREKKNTKQKQVTYDEPGDQDEDEEGTAKYKIQRKPLKMQRNFRKMKKAIDRIRIDFSYGHLTNRIKCHVIC